MTGQLARQAATAVSAYQDQAPTTLTEEQARWELLVQQATFLASAEQAIPRGYRDRNSKPVPGKMVAAGLAGMAFGWDLMTSMRAFDIMPDGPRMKTEFQVGIIRRAGHTLTIRRDLPESVTVTGRRADTGEQLAVEWTRERAASIPTVTWDNNQKVTTTLLAKWDATGTTPYMLHWRALSEIGRFLFSDLTLGLAYAPGERDDVDELDVEPLAEIAPVAQQIVASSITVEATPAAEPEQELQTDLFGQPAPLPNTTPPWTDWGRAEWANHCAGRLSLPEIGREWSIRNFDGVAAAEDHIRAAIYDAAGPLQ